jgi:hypothetical protein
MRPNETPAPSQAPENILIDSALKPNAFSCRECFPKTTMKGSRLSARNA